MQFDQVRRIVLDCARKQATIRPPELMREIVLDTETTGLEPDDGHRLVEIGASRSNGGHVPTGRTFHVYFNPAAGHAAGRLSRSTACPTNSCRTSHYSATWPSEFLEFIGDARLVIHNAGFDMRFLNAELARLKPRPLPWSASSTPWPWHAAPSGGRRLDALPAIWHRQFQARPARSSARCRDPGRGLCRAHGGRQTDPWSCKREPVDHCRPRRSATCRCGQRPQPASRPVDASRAAAHPALSPARAKSRSWDR